MSLSINPMMGDRSASGSQLTNLETTSFFCLNKCLSLRLELNENSKHKGLHSLRWWTDQHTTVTVSSMAEIKQRGLCSNNYLGPHSVQWNVFWFYTCPYFSVVSLWEAVLTLMMDDGRKMRMFCVIVIRFYGEMVSAVWFDFNQIEVKCACLLSHFEGCTVCSQFGSIPF